MKRYRQFQPLIISHFETGEWQHPVHQHNHYEFIFIQKGSGRHVINQSRIDYKQGNIFLIGPDEEHYFEIAERTGFVFIKFTDPYMYNETVSPGQLRHLEYLMSSRKTHLSAFQLNGQDQKTLEHMIAVILSLKDDLLANEQLIWFQILALANLLQRNMPELNPTVTRTRDMQAIFCYIHKHIYSPDKLRATAMAGHFNTTPGYMGPYFKRNAGITLREYIRNYRRTLLQQRIEHGHSLKQIAAEFGLTDESHVGKLVR